MFGFFNKRAQDQAAQAERTYDSLREKMYITDRCEAEGVAAGLEGKKRADCPYDEKTQSTEWNFWVYGCENAGGELAMIKGGKVDVAMTTVCCSTGEGSFEAYEDYAKNHKPKMIPVDEAIRTGQWKPRYYKGGA